MRPRVSGSSAGRDRPGEAAVLGEQRGLDTRVLELAAQVADGRVGGQRLRAGHHHVAHEAIGRVVAVDVRVDQLGLAHRRRC